MIDFHTHILHDIDDGPNRLKGSVEMARVAVADGTRVIVATPHAPGPGYSYRAELVKSRLADLRKAINKEDIPLEVLPGGELFCDTSLVKHLRNGLFLPCGDSHTVLMECPIYDSLPDEFEQVVTGLQDAGYRVVLAHPERINDVREDPNVLIPFIERGMFAQLTTQALTGEQGEPNKHLASVLLTHNLIHLLASDAHGATYRPPKLSRAYQCAVDLVGEAASNRLVYDTPYALLHDEEVRIPTPVAVEQGWRG